MMPTQRLRRLVFESFGLWLKAIGTDDEELRFGWYIRLRTDLERIIEFKRTDEFAMDVSSMEVARSDH